jgi:hypothetical protein
MDMSAILFGAALVMSGVVTIRQASTTVEVAHAR